MTPPPNEPPPESGEGGVGEPPLRAGHRKKSAWVRSWLLVEPTGETQVVEAGKHAIMRRTGLPARDLRILDPVLSYPSTILGRERAVVVSLEHIKVIITAHEVLFLNARDPLVTPFVAKLQGIFRHREAVKSTQDGGVSCGNAAWANLYSPEDSQTIAASSDQIYTGNFPNKNEGGNVDAEQKAEENAPCLNLLPFEFVAIEACLEAACTSLDEEAKRLEQEAHPALDKLTSKISTLNLERVRQIKSRLVAITGRVQKVRDELENLLDDDEDMAEMYLTKKSETEQRETSSASSIDGLHVVDEEADPLNEENKSPVDSDTEIEVDNEQTIGERYSRRSASTKNLDVEELEMILEAYFVQIEGTLNKLSTLREYVDDTEDYLNIMLDDKQNHLLQMGVMLTTATVVVNAFIALVGVFGMNITIELFDDQKAGMPDFLWTCGGGAIGCVVLYVAAFVWYKHKRLLA